MCIYIYIYIMSLIAAIIDSMITLTLEKHNSIIIIVYIID